MNQFISLGQELKMHKKQTHLLLTVRQFLNYYYQETGQRSDENHHLLSILKLLCCHLLALWLMSFYTVHTLIGHIFRYTLLVLDWTVFCFQNWHNPSWHGLTKVMETFLRGPYRDDSITQLLHIWWCESHTSLKCCTGFSRFGTNVRHVFMIQDKYLKQK